MCEVLGHCSECGRLLTIVPRGNVPGSRQQRWFPSKHPVPTDDTGGVDCPGMKVAL